ncbi:MAG: hypothetical protein WKF87_08925 [Chryseolinea sp.]
MHPVNTDGTLCDLRDLYRHITFRSEGPKATRYLNLYDYRFDFNATQHNVWRNLTCFVHGYRKEDLPDLLTYQKKNFASSTFPNEALIQLYPLPSPHNHAWYYSWLPLQQLEFLKSRTLYEEHLYDNRVNNILSKIRTHKPRVVLMYGMNNINRLKKSIQDFFDGTKFETIKATKLQIPQHHWTDLKETTILITTQIPALRHNRIETGFDWEEFGKISQR